MDIGSGWARMGLAGEDTPSCVFPSVVGRMNLRAYDQILGQVCATYLQVHTLFSSGYCSI